MPHYEYFTVEVWVRFNQDSEYDKKISQVMGEVIRKSEVTIPQKYKPNLFGIDMNEDTIRFYYMGHYMEYDLGPYIPLGDEEWHFISVTFRRFE